MGGVALNARPEPLRIQADQVLLALTQYTLRFKVAEGQARLDETLIYLGEIYNDEVTTEVEGLTTALEPFLMIFLGLVGTLVVAVFLPMTTMMQVLEK
ncbi:hypothetical protein [Deinococcus sp.]|uniref:hypothetical protein n=1 Tax=Deinococcus sp. TaxID=47478 RepID=UPI003CC658CC